jgi:hypothetical protein
MMAAACSFDISWYKLPVTARRAQRENGGLGDPPKVRWPTNRSDGPGCSIKPVTLFPWNSDAGVAAIEPSYGLTNSRA